MEKFFIKIQPLKFATGGDSYETVEVPVLVKFPLLVDGFGWHWFAVHPHHAREKLDDKKDTVVLSEWTTGFRVKELGPDRFYVSPELLAEEAKAEIRAIIETVGPDRFAATIERARPETPVNVPPKEWLA